MKKIFTLLALMVATVAAMANGYAPAHPAKAAGDVTPYTQSMYCKGGWMFGENFIETTGVALNVTENADGTYDFNFPGLALETKEMGKTTVDGGLSITGVAATTNASGYTIFSKEYEYSGSNLNVSGVAYGDKIYLLMEGQFLYMSGCTIVYGEEIVVPQEPEFTPVNKEYKDNAFSSYKGTVSNIDEATADVTETAEGVYTFVLKQLVISDNLIGDFTIENVTGTKNEEDGSVSYAFEGNATTTGVSWIASNALDFSEGGVVAVKLEGNSKDEKLKVVLTFPIKDSDAVYTFGERGEETGISSVNAAAINGNAAIYTVTGAKVNAMQKGINIVRMNGKAVKVLKK